MTCSQNLNRYYSLRTFRKNDRKKNRKKTRERVMHKERERERDRERERERQREAMSDEVSHFNSVPSAQITSIVTIKVPPLSDGPSTLRTHSLNAAVSRQISPHNQALF